MHIKLFIFLDKQGLFCLVPGCFLGLFENVGSGRPVSRARARLHKQLKISGEFLHLFPMFWKIFSHCHGVSNAL